MCNDVLTQLALFILLEMPAGGSLTLMSPGFATGPANLARSPTPPSMVGLVGWIVSPPAIAQRL
jgi:hypothetical protein